MAKRQLQRNSKVLAAGIAGFLVVLLLGLGLNFGGFQGRTQAQADQPILPSLDFTPTPTIPPSPTPEPVLADAVLANPALQHDDSLELWEFVDVGAMMPEDRSVWKVEDGALLQNRTASMGNPNTYETMAFFGNPNWMDYTVQARFYDQGNGNAGLVVRRQDDNFYRLRLIANAYSDAPRFILELVTEGVAKPLATLDAPGYEFHAWYDVALRVQGDELQATLNGDIILTAEDQTLTQGQPGLYTRAMGNIRFGNIIVTE